ncbi:DUF3054 family protein [Natronomonas moolapensis 8.8.11]|uniref:DUF3054 family protein n=1 Tax=Natronomonas moolapensis (strain DSM 18674 / CECT 7526 / JCM 14361 / 8.8.11) TaxID=268739 RepID=M1XKS5_NATM8|nr:DUF3054 domain-containing protein [Natronomonas moolapensis]CCQ36425.1 DUF3054 family protein [Natronomonas moolapensis 8.8.11]
MADQSFLQQRLDAGTWPIAVGDVAVLLAFLLAGTLQHSTTEQLLADPSIYLLAAGPFVLGWLLCAPLVGAYSPGGGSAPNSSIPLAIRSWIPAAVVGMAIRVVALRGRGAEVAFAVVMLVGGTVALSAWRFIYFKLR